MIGKIKISNRASFGPICAYVVGEEKEAEVLATHGVRGTSAAHMAADFDTQRALNPALGRAVMHVALAWPAEEKQMSNELMLTLTQAWMKEMKIDAAGTQWSLTRHHETSHPHGHLILNRVDNEGGTVSDQHNYRNSMDACRKLEKQYGLVSAPEVGQDKRRAVREQLPARDAAKLYVQDALSRHLPQVTSPAELVKALQRDGIGVQTNYQKQRLQAVVFEYEGHYLKGSELGRSYSGNNLAKTIEAQRDQVQQQHAAVSVAGAQYGQFGAELEAFGQAYGAHKQQAEDAVRRAQERQAQEQQAQAEQHAAEQARQGMLAREQERVQIEQRAGHILQTNPRINTIADFEAALQAQGVAVRLVEGKRRLSLQGSANEFTTTDIRPGGRPLNEQVVNQIEANNRAKPKEQTKSYDQERD